MVANYTIKLPFLREAAILLRDSFQPEGDPVQARDDTPIDSTTTAVDFYIPDLCRVRALLLLIVTTELMAMLFSLAQPGAQLLNWEYLGLVSLFGQWTVLTCAAALCSSRRWLSTLSTPIATVVSLLLIQLVALLYSVISLHVLFPGDAAGSNPGLFYLRNGLIAAIISGITLRYFYLQDLWQRQRQSELLSRLEALQARIRPHFLFNSMNTIASLIATNPTVAEEAVLDLSELFRASLRTQDRLVPLDHELDLCRRYLQIEALRLGPRMKTAWEVTCATADLRIPPLTLQPLIENAIYHGIQPLPEGGCIRIHIERRATEYTIMISNPVAEGSKPLQRDPDSGHHGNQIALGNIRDRLDALYGPQAVLKSSVMNRTFTVTLRLLISGKSSGAKA